MEIIFPMPSELKTTLKQAIDIYLELNKEHLKKSYRSHIHKKVKAEIAAVEFDRADVERAIKAILNYNIEPTKAIEYAIEKKYL